MPHRLFDPLTVRCPQLGSEVTFGYCRVLQDGLPCRRALACFDRRFPVEAFFRRVLHDATFERCFAAPPADDRYGALLEAVHEAQRRNRS